MCLVIRDLSLCLFGANAAEEGDPTGESVGVLGGDRAEISFILEAASEYGWPEPLDRPSITACS